MAGGAASLVTGAASGLGRAIAVALADLGHSLTLLDLDTAGLEETERLIRARPSNSGVSTQCEAFDMTDATKQRAAFERHASTYSRLDVVVLSAGIAERGPFFEEANTGWQKTLDVDLTSVLVGVRCAAFVMKQTNSRGIIISIASAGGFFPMPVSPVYAAAKAGLIQFTRSAASPLYKQHGIRLMAMCPEFVDTPLVQTVLSGDKDVARRMLGCLDSKLLTPAQVTEVAVALATGEHPAGTVVLQRLDGSALQVFPQSRVALPYAAGIKPFTRSGSGPTASGRPVVSPASLAARASWAAAHLPAKFRKLQVHKLSSKFSEATRIVEAPMPGTDGTLPAGQILVRRAYVGINASDINYTAGRYHNSLAEAERQLPFDCGFESVNVVVKVGDGVRGFYPGDAVAAMSYGAFSEYGLVPASQALPVPSPVPAVVALLTSGLTASIALEEAGRIKKGEVVMVTAAAGGTGQFAVQLAKLAGCTVIATCSSSDKAALLRQLGADRVVNYKAESLKAVLKAEYPRGVDVVYESVGGDMFNTALNALAPRARLIVIGMISQYESGWPANTYPGLAEKLLWKSASVTGFFLLKYAHLFKAHLQRLTQLLDKGELRAEIDQTRFVGLDNVGRAVEHLYSGRSVGKIVVQMAPEAPPQAASRM